MIDTIFIENECDKGSLFHHYHHFYDFMIQSVKPKVLVEIGYGDGKSYQSWVKALPDSQIIMADKEAKDNVAVVGDMGSGIGLHKLLDSLYVEPCVIIDDASHIFEDQIASFHCLFPRIRSGGMFVIEDLQNQEYASYFTRFGGFMVDTRPMGKNQDDMLIVIPRY